MSFFYFGAGIILGLIYSASTMPATVWVVRSTFTHGFKRGLSIGLALSISQLPWALLAAQLLLNSKQPFILLDPALRVVVALFFIWMALQVKRSGKVDTLKLNEQTVNTESPFRSTLRKGFFMPWRLVIWIGLVISISIHLRSPGWLVAGAFAKGTVIGTFGWYVYFAALTALFGKRVPEPISIKSLNKLRLLSFTVFLGLGLLVLAPLLLLLE